jgi:hypothetical protein
VDSGQKTIALHVHAVLLSNNEWLCVLVSSVVSAQVARSECSATERAAFVPVRTENGCVRP